jgi:hypothetical protein
VKQLFAISLAVAATVAACAGAQSPPLPDETCKATCARRVPRCGEVACERGCTLALDRLVENEGDAVIACVARSSAPCDDWLWADCAARIGPHADGGPAAPVPGPRH